MVVGAAAYTGWLGACGQLGHVRGDVDQADVGLVFGLRGRGETVGKERHDDEADDQNVQTNGNDLSPAEVFVFTPDVLDADGLYLKRQRWLFGGGEEFLDARAKAAEAFDPTGGEPAVRGAFGNGPAAEEVAEVVPQKPPPYSSGIRSDFTSPWILTGRSNRSLFGVGTKKSSGMRIAGRPKRGTTGDEPGGEELGRSGPVEEPGWGHAAAPN